MRVQELLPEAGKASKKLCRSKKPDHALGASQLASCKSQGYRKRSGKKSYKICQIAEVIPRTKFQ